MAITLSEFENKLAKLQRNRDQTTEAERRGKYRAQFEKFERSLLKDANSIMLQFLQSGMRFANEDEGAQEEVLQTEKRIIREEADEIRRVNAVLLQTLEAEAFLEEVCVRLQPRFWFEAYAPYWVRHCKPQGSFDGRPQYYNDLIDMYWHDEHQVWTNVEGNAWTIMLPPTMELVRKERILNEKSGV